MIPSLIAYAVVFAAAFLAPGWLLGRALGAPTGPAGLFLGSVAILTNLILTLDALGLALTRTNVLLGLAVVCAGLGLAARRPAPDLALTGASPGLHRAWLIAPAIALAGLAWKAIEHPLFGYDTIFRWDFLARQMWEQGTLQFYPAVTPGDFLIYGWPDGLAPAVACLYFWAYQGLGAVHAGATVPVVLLQVALLFWAVHDLAARLAGRAAGLAASALLATSSLVLWGSGMGQETGLTALALVGVLLFAERHRTEPGARWCAWAGIAAGVGALAREYGIVFVALGALALAGQRASGRGWLAYLGAFAVVAAPWYLRNAARTGNPLWPHSFGGWLPDNRVHTDYMRAVADFWGPGSSSWPPFAGLGTAVLLSIVVVASAVVGAWRLPARRTWPMLAAAVTVTLLWAWSLSSTSAGHLYALRVLTPGVAIGAVIGGAEVGRWTRPAVVWLGALVCAVAAVDAAARVWFLPAKPWSAWWTVPPGQWLQGRDAGNRWNHDPNWDTLVAAAGGRPVLVSDPFTHVALTKRGAKAIPLFSPDVAFLFDPGQDLASGLNRLRGRGVRFALLSADNVINASQLPRYPFFRSLLAIEPNVKIPTTLVYDLANFPDNPPAPARPPP
ncbi:MAG: glycosyltransferase family 39 protein [Opitutaceae bacterium]|nr:glycosyltransferase family 39 protein [Opitutaceae bacterium]